MSVSRGREAPCLNSESSRHLRGSASYTDAILFWQHPASRQDAVAFQHFFREICGRQHAKLVSLGTSLIYIDCDGMVLRGGQVLAKSRRGWVGQVLRSGNSARRGTGGSVSIPAAEKKKGKSMRAFFRFAAGIAIAAVATISVAQENKPTSEEFGELVLRYAQTDLQAWINDPVIIFAIKEQNELHKDMNQLRINRLDYVWREEGAYGALVIDLLDRQASIIARDRRAASEGVITEIIVMDAYGLNVAISDRTSDYFQGDEAKWIETYQKGANAVHISELEFDESTGKIQTQVSLTVVDPESGDPIGAVTLGIDLDQLATN